MLETTKPKTELQQNNVYLMLRNRSVNISSISSRYVLSMFAVGLPVKPQSSLQGKKLTKHNMGKL